jgi:hypothetical protein
MFVKHNRNDLMQSATIYCNQSSLTSPSIHATTTEAHSASRMTRAATTLLGQPFPEPSPVAARRSPLAAPTGRLTVSRILVSLHTVQHVAHGLHARGNDDTLATEAA